MPGRFSLYPDLTVEENLNFFATIFQTTVKDNYHWIEAIYRSLEPFKNRRAGKLSGGMKQKLALSCALIHKPSTLLLDEPTTGVDPVSRREFWEILKRLKEQGVTIVAATPYMDEANLCDRIALIQNGEILSVETPRKMAAAYPKKLYRTAADDNFTLLKQLRANQSVESCFLFGAYLHVTFKGEADRTIAGLEEIEPSVEDCFIALRNDKRRQTIQSNGNQSN
jgi:ABC-type multidrug transport system ATPase subunit